jgi:hypothetical protein
MAITNRAADRGRKRDLSRIYRRWTRAVRAAFIERSLVIFITQMPIGRRLLG